MGNVQSVERALSILEYISGSPDGVSISELSRELGLHKSTIHRILSTLVERGFVRNDEKNRRYKPGFKLFEIGSLVLNNLELRKEVHPFLEELKEKTGETIHLGILDEYEVLYIDKVESPQTIRMYSMIGKKAPLHCTGLGKTLLAFSSPSLLDEVVEKKGLKKFTNNTITEKEKLREHLKEVRERGYAIDDSEHEREIKCVAGPIFDYNNQLIAAFSISTPITRITKERMDYFIKLVLEYSERISKSLGYVKKDA